MRSQLTQRILRQLATHALYADLQCTSHPLSQRCLQRRRGYPIFPLPFHHQTRTLFGLSSRSKRKPKPVNYEPGYETLLQLDERLKMGVRPPLVDEIVEAFNSLVEHKYPSSRLEDVQVDHLKTAYLYLRNQDGEAREQSLAFLDLSKALVVLKQTPSPGHISQSHVALSELLFEQCIINRSEVNAEGELLKQHESQFWTDLTSHIGVLAHNGQALGARDVVYKHLVTILANKDIKPWLLIINAMIKENREDDLEKTIERMRDHHIPFSDRLHHHLVNAYAYTRGDVAMARKWYDHPIAGDRPPNIETIICVLQLCMRKKELEWGETIAKSLLERNPVDKRSLDLILRWAASKGRGVDEIERMMEVTVRRNEDRTYLHPDISTINGLVGLANLENDPYTAERYVALGQKWGLQPNARTFLLQLDYRIKVNDLAGAIVAYKNLRALDPGDINDAPCINNLICALCASPGHYYDLIMSLVDDLTERRLTFLPQAVAALANLHLQRNETADLVDLLNTNVFRFGLSERDEIRQVLLKYILDPSIPEPRAWEIYNVLRNIFDDTDTGTRVKLMKWFFSRNRPDMATHVFGHMRQSQIKSQRPTVDTYAVCLSGIGKAGDAESLETVHNMMKLDSEIEPSTKMHNALMLGYAGCGNPQRALEFWEDIVHSREGPTYGSIQIAFKACEKASFGERVAKSIWDRLKKYDIEVTREIYAAYVAALAGQDLFVECVRLCDRAEDEGLSVDALM